MSTARYVMSAIVVGWLSALAAAPLVRADAVQQQNFARWKTMNNCAAAALKQFPDHTPGSNAKREAARRDCLRANQFPVPSAAPAQQPR